MVRSTPRSTSRLSPAASVTLACRSRISRVDIKLSFLTQPDEDVAAVDLHWIGSDRLGGRGAGWLAGPQVEARAMQPALHRVVVDIALGQRDLFVRADVMQREYLALGANDRNGHAIHFDAECALSRQIRQRAGAAELGHASSPSIAAVIRSRSSGTSMCPINSPKKPRMTRLRASSNGMPRAIR